MKTSWSRRIYSPYSYVFRRRLHQDQYIRLDPTSSRHLQDVFKASSKHLQDILQKRFQDIFKMYSRRFESVFKTSSRHFQDVLQICLQDVFKTCYQVKLFSVTQFQHVFETYSKRFWDVLLRLLSTGGLPRLHFGKTYGQCTKFPRVIKVSQVLVFHFTTLFSGCLQRPIENLVEHLHWSFFSKIPNVVKLLTIFARKPPSQMFDWVENRLLAKGFKYHRKN